MLSYDQWLPASQLSLTPVSDLDKVLLLRPGLAIDSSLLFLLVGETGREAAVQDSGDAFRRFRIYLFVKLKLYTGLELILFFYLLIFHGQRLVYFG